MAKIFWKRYYRLVIKTENKQKTLESGENMLRLTFSVNKVAYGTTEQSMSTISIYNVNDDTKALLDDKKADIELYAGYEGHYGKIFDGRVIRTYIEMDGADEKVTINAQDTAQDKLLENVVVSIRGEKTAYEILQSYVDGAKYTSVFSPAAISKLSEIKFTRYSFTGSFKDFFTEIATKNGISWNVNNGIIYFVVDGQTYNTNSKILITKETGLLGRPKREYSNVVSYDYEDSVRECLWAWEIRFLLNSGIDLLSTICVKTEEMNGEYYVAKLSFVGDTHSSSWEGTAEVVAQKGES